MRILIVDDDEIGLDLLDNCLQENGYEVVRASNGREALEILRSSPCRIVVSDWRMPEMDGPDLCRGIRSKVLGPYTYFILLTGYSEPQAALEGFTAGADDFVRKPFDPRELILRVRVGERILSIESRDVAIFAMAKLAESRDPETGAHLERVRTYARTLAAELSQRESHSSLIDGEYCQLLYLTSPLHDIGKIGMPDHVLLKPGRLSDDEFDIMKSHTVIGAQALEAAMKQHPEATFLSMARDIALGHHERHDGKGYPNGLQGQDIPLAARIVAVADVYDALTSKRVYKSAMSEDIADSIIAQESGKHFDPDVVDAFLTVKLRFREIHDTFKEEPAPQPSTVAAQGCAARP